MSATAPAPARLPPASPCIGVCVIDSARGLCTGCVRTLDEIAVWGSAPDAVRAAVWKALPARAAAERLALRRLDWRGAALLDAVEQRLAQGAAVLAGAPGTTARFAGPPAAARRNGDVLTITAPPATLRLEAPPWLTAFEIARAGAAPLIALAVPSGRARAATAADLAGAVETPCLRLQGGAAAAMPAVALPGGYAPTALIVPA